MKITKFRFLALGLALIALVSLVCVPPGRTTGRTNITGQVPLGPYTTVTAGALDLTWTAADTTNNNEFLYTGKDVLLVWNTDTASHHFTLTSAPDEHGRTGDVTSYTIATGKISAFSFRQGSAGWLETADGHVYIAGDDPTVKFAIISPAN